MRRASQDPDSVRVRDTEHLVAAARFLSIHHYVTVSGPRDRRAADDLFLLKQLRASHTLLPLAPSPSPRQSAQLVQLLALLPPGDAAPGALQVELASTFWARCVDRRQGWSDVLRALGPEQQVGAESAWVRV